MAHTTSFSVYMTVFLLASLGVASISIGNRRAGEIVGISTFGLLTAWVLITLWAVAR